MRGLSKCLSVKLGFPPSLTNTLWLFIEVEQKAMLTAFSLVLYLFGTLYLVNVSLNPVTYFPTRGIYTYHKLH